MERVLPNAIFRREIRNRDGHRYNNHFIDYQEENIFVKFFFAIWLQSFAEPDRGHLQDPLTTSSLPCYISPQKDGFVKSPSAPLRAELRFNLVVAAPKGPHSSVFARLASGAFYEPPVLVTFIEIIKKDMEKALARYPVA
ncbi:MAG: hypothetical protein H6Q42_3923 [Deltaproteobacteria bacterium]|nr:hypothetical protein [Deltaproteobacteria bacterium]